MGWTLFCGSSKIILKVIQNQFMTKKPNVSKIIIFKSTCALRINKLK